MHPIRFAIIGAGNIAPLHARSIAEIDGASLVAVMDIVGAKAEKLAGEYLRQVGIPGDSAALDLILLSRS